MTTFLGGRLLLLQKAFKEEGIMLSHYEHKYISNQPLLPAPRICTFSASNYLAGAMEDGAFEGHFVSEEGSL